jgi:hypothetical protein
MKTQKEIRLAFWQQSAYKHLYRSYKKHNDYNATIRTEFSFFIDYLVKDGIISQQLSENVTL